MTKVYFVRHAQSDFNHPDAEDDRIRPLTEEGKQDTKAVLTFLKDKNIDLFYCSPYKRSVDTIRITAEFFGKDIITDERLRERASGPDGNNHEMFQKRWADHSYHEAGGESLAMVQERNIAALLDILKNNQNKNIVIGTHGTALSMILNFYDNSYNCDSFLRIIDWMPFIIELDFEGTTLIKQTEHIHMEKEFKGKARIDKTHEVQVNFYDSVTDEKLKFAVIISKTDGKWIFCKHKERNTYEVPGGHREPGETILETARRELQEETGAIDFDITPLCVYSVTGKTKVNETIDDKETFGMLYFANIRTFEKELHSEIEKIMITDQLPTEWTYPLIQPKLLEKAAELGVL